MAAQQDSKSLLVALTFLQTEHYFEWLCLHYWVSKCWQCHNLFISEDKKCMVSGGYFISPSLIIESDAKYYTTGQTWPIFSSPLISSCIVCISFLMRVYKLRVKVSWRVFTLNGTIELCSMWLWRRRREVNITSSHQVIIPKQIDQLILAVFLRASDFVSKRGVCQRKKPKAPYRWKIHLKKKTSNLR